jgi:hypothetical protein
MTFAPSDTGRRFCYEFILLFYLLSYLSTSPFLVVFYDLALFTFLPFSLARVLSFFEQWIDKYTVDFYNSGVSAEMAGFVDSILREDPNNQQAAIVQFKINVCKSRMMLFLSFFHSFHSFLLSFSSFSCAELFLLGVVIFLSC